MRSIIEIVLTIASLIFFLGAMYYNLNKDKSPFE